MLNEILKGLCLGFVTAWVVYAFLKYSRYYGALGFIRKGPAARRASEDDRKVLEDILADDDLGAGDREEEIDSKYYAAIATRSPLVYMLNCPYCLGMWAYLIISAGFFLVHGIENAVDIFVLGYAFSIFNLRLGENH